MLGKVGMHVSDPKSQAKPSFAAGPAGGAKAGVCGGARGGEEEKGLCRNSETEVAGHGVGIRSL